MGKITKNDAERVFFQKNVFMFLKAFFRKIGGANYATGSRPSCLRYESKIFISIEKFLYPMFANCVHANIGSLFTSEREFFSKNSSTLAVECDWNSKFSQDLQNVPGFEKSGFLKTFFEQFQNPQRWQIFCRTFIKWYRFLKMSSPVL